MRAILVMLHRWLGLATAVFLLLAGLTGAVIAWDHELDEWLNPRLFRAATPGSPALDAAGVLALAQRIETEHPGLRARYMPLQVEAGHTLQLIVMAKPDPATRTAPELGYDQVFVDPGTGAIQATRQWGIASLHPEHLLPFLYRFHYSLHLSGGTPIELGVLLMGIVAIAWMLDSAIALWIAFPSRKAWRKSFAFRVREGGYKLTFDLHRSSGVWLFPVLLLFAVTAITMNLGDEVVKPVVQTFSTLQTTPFDVELWPEGQQPEPGATREQVMESARSAAAARGITDPAGGLFYAPGYDTYGVGFFSPGNPHGDGGLGVPWLYFRAQDGSPAGGAFPGEGSAGDLFMQVQFPLHSGRIAGTVGRALVSVLGVVIAMLSVTGIAIFARKRRARVARGLRGEPARPGGVVAGGSSSAPA